MAERFAAAGGEDVREPAPVCPCCRGMCGGRALGAAAEGAGGRKDCGVQADKHFFAWMAAAPQALPEAHCGCELEVDMYQRITVLYSPEKRDSTKTYLSFNQRFTSHSENEIPGQARNDARKPALAEKETKKTAKPLSGSERSDQGVLEGVRPLDERGNRVQEKASTCACLFLYPRGESNAYRRNRNPKFYPLNYRGIP